MVETKELLVYVWVFIFSLVVGVLSFFKKRSSATTPFRIGVFILGVTCSMAVGYMTFEIAYYYFEKERIAVAIAGLGAWMGTDALLSFEGAFKEIVKNKSKGTK